MQRPADERPTDVAIVPATPAEVLAGATVAAPGDCRCQACGRPLRERERVVAYAYRPVDVEGFDVARVYCDADECRPEIAGTLGCWDVLAEATLALQATPGGRRHRLALADVSVAELRDPERGSEA